MKKFLLSLVFLIFLFINSLSAENAKATVKQFINQKDWSFVENKGQLYDESGIILNNVKYYGHQGGVYLYCKPGMISFVFTKVDKNQNISEATGAIDDGVGVQNSEPLRGKQPFDRSSHSALRSSISTSHIDLFLINSNPNASITGSEPQPNYENYYNTGNANEGITDVNTFKTITYKNIYPHIDMVLHAKESGMKYELVVYPGANISDIQLQWNGLQGMKAIKDGGIKYAFSTGEMTETRPVCFQGTRVVASSFAKQYNRIGFKVAGYDKGKTLIIDPYLFWGTYWGSYGNDVGDAVLTDNFGNVYLSGSTGGPSSLKYSGALLAKFDRNGKLLWSTYYGPTSSQAISMSRDKSGNVYISGITNASSGIATSGAYQTVLSGGDDAYLAKFRSNGKLVWGTYFGGKSEDNTFATSNDDSGNVYIVGGTTSNSGIATNNSFKSSYSGGYYNDGFIAKFDSTGAIKWATYYGGSGDDVIDGLGIDISGNVYIAGNSTSASGISTNGAHQSSYGGGKVDGFLAKFDNNGNRKWASYFGGKGKDICRSLIVNKTDLYLVGYTASSSGIASAGAYQTSYGGGSYDAFLAKFDTSGNMKWGSYYGGKAEDDGYSITYDNLGNIYLLGQSASDSSIATNGAYQTSLAGRFNAFIAKFSNDCKLTWATYYGGNDNTYGYGISANNTGDVFITGMTYSTSGIATSGAYQTSNATNIDMFLAKFNFSVNNDAGIASILSPKGSFCSDTQKVVASLENFGINELDSVEIGWSVNGKIQATHGWKGKLKTDSTVAVSLSKYHFIAQYDTIKIWTYNPNGVTDSITQNDTAQVIDTLKSPIASYQTTIQKCGIVNFKAGLAASSPTSISRYLWSGIGAPGYSILDISASSGSYQYTRGGNYRYSLTVTGSNGCSTIYTDSVKINPFPGISLPKDTTMCANTSLNIMANPLNAFQPYKIWWNFKDSKGDSLTTGSITEKFTKDSSVRVNILDQGCTNYDSMKVHVIPVPKPDLGPDKRGCSGQGVMLTTGLTHMPNVKWMWIQGKNTVTNKYKGDTILAEDSGIYVVSVQDSLGCTGTDTVNVSFNPLVRALSLDTTVCYGDSVTLHAGISGAGASYTWMDLVHNKVVSTNSIFKFLAVGSTGHGVQTDLEVIIKQSKNGLTCVDTGHIKVSVRSMINVNTGLNDTICAGNKASIGGVADTAYNYNWTSSPLGFSSTIANPNVSPATSTTYFLKETYKSTGCAATDSAIVVVNPLPKAYAGGNQSLCMGASTDLGVSPISGNSYSWTSIPTGFSSSSANPVVNPSSTTIYYLKDTINATGCSATDSAIITVNPLPKSSFSYTNVCPGDSSVFTDKSTLANAYEWYFGDGGTSTLSGPKHLYTSNGNYIISLKVISSDGCSDSSSQKISINNCVWPGDANDDKKVDMNDFLAIGHAFGTKGHLRPSASTSWVGQPAPDWDSVFTNGVNYKHADCNGDSIIDYSDTVAISDNYGKTHSKSNVLNQGASSDPSFTIKSTSDTIYAGDTLKAIISTGTSANKVQNIYGMLFSLGLNPAVFDLNNARLEVNPSFLGSLSTDLMAMKINNVSSGLMDVGLTRINQLNVSGYGSFATLYVTVKNTLPTKTLKSAVGISDNVQLSYNGKNIPLFFSSDSFIVKQDRSGISNVISGNLSAINIYPNPFQNTCEIEYKLLQKSNVQIALYDMTGKQIAVINNKTQQAGTYKTEISALKYNLITGIYELRIMTDNGYVSRHIVKL